MRLERVAYRKLFGFEVGELDLRQIPPGLVALTGENWQGKSMFLELILAAVYRETASRATNDIAAFATARDSWVEADFVVDGVGAFRARVAIDGVARPRKVQAVLQQLQPDGRTVPLNDGKVRSFDEAVAQLVPRKDGLLCSAFAAQNRAGSLTSVPRAKRKDLFLQFLWQEHVIAKGETAKLCLQAADRVRTALEAQRTLIARETSPEILRLLHQQAEELTAQADDLAQTRTSLVVRIDEWTAEREAQWADAQAHAAAHAQVTALTATIVATERELQQIARDRAQAEQHAAQDRARVDREAAQRRRTLDRQIAECDATLRDAAAIRAAAKRVETATAALTEARASESQLRATEAHAREQIRHREQELKAVEAAEAQLERLTRKIPCATYKQCQLVAEKRALEGQRDELLAAKRRGPTLRQGVTHWTRTLETVQGQVAEVLATIEQQEATVRRHTQQASRVAQLDVAEARIAAYRQQLTQVDEDVAASHKAIDARLASQRAELDRREADGRNAVVIATHELTAQHAEMERTAAASARVTTIDAEVTTAMDSMVQCQTQAAALTVRLEDSSRAMAAAEARSRDVAALDQRIAEVQAAWRVQALLAKGLHRDGLPTLEIAAAGPAISQLCTDLLEHCGFGTRFTVEVTTQLARADGKGLKEDFAVLVWDNEQGGEPRDLGDMSGGEQILVEEALRAAMSIVVNTRHAHPVSTCWRDETTGPLSTANRQRYLTMLRRLRELGGFTHVLFVSHADDAVDAADTVFEVRQGVATMRRAA